MRGLNYKFNHIGTVRGGKAKAALFARVVDGKSYTMREIAEQLGVSKTTADKRVRRGPCPPDARGRRRRSGEAAVLIRAAGTTGTKSCGYAGNSGK
ncbi:sigma-70 region 4 domain-containing protein [Stenotrophomonas maltophilia]|uniref:sigma-70 region 4 domain-containing protein n=1 Tax=Stenotrophomonas maltophilia TaxID=40324 RepID=UPI0013D958DE|nr:sigma-70 region 4 domain-containing protein [Stenotrophomonas maltophilia]